MKVFISSLISGMEEFRDATARAIRSLGHEVIRAEDFGALPDSPQITCLRGVREAEAVVLLMGGSYGAVQSSGLSATHEEYREARERCPVLIMVQDGVEREPAQAQFLNEARDWAQGHYTQSFSDADQLRDAVVGALHNMELAYATGPVDADEILERAIALLPSNDRRSYSGNTRLALALTGGPLQTILRPAQLEQRDLQESLQQLALFGDAAVLTPREGTASNIDNDALVFSQPNGSVAITETGALRLIATVPAPDEGLPVIIEEDVRDIISRFLHFSDAVLTFVDPVSRLSHVVVAAKLLDEGHLAWRTRAEHSRSPNSVSMGGYGDGEHEPVHLSPPHRTRSALRQMESELVDDLMVKLRRQLQNPRREPW